METIRLTTDIRTDGTIHIDATSKLHPGPVEVVLILKPANGERELGSDSDSDRRIAAAEALAALSLPVDTIDVMNRQATSNPALLLP